MAEVVSRSGSDAHMKSHSERAVQEEIIEERRKDAEGRVGTFRYIKGKMLGKVSTGCLFCFFDIIDTLIPAVGGRMRRNY